MMSFFVLLVIKKWGETGIELVNFKENLLLKNLIRNLITFLVETFKGVSLKYLRFIVAKDKIF